MHRETPFAQMACGDEGIATVIARPGEDQQRRPLDTTKGSREIGRSQPRALHQRLIGGDALTVPRRAAHRHHFAVVVEGHRHRLELRSGCHRAHRARHRLPRCGQEQTAS
jgi:hypothetical protein